MVPPLLDTLNNEGVKYENVTVIFACGLQRAVKPEEAVKLLGEHVCTRVRAVSHDSRAQDLAHVGTTQKYGTEVLLNRLFTEADVRILTGDIGLHYFAGYGGGRKSVLPGISGEEMPCCWIRMRELGFSQRILFIKIWLKQQRWQG
jgi:nickel-dependent lactate racemase